MIASEFQPPGRREAEQKGRVGAQKQRLSLGPKKVCVCDSESEGESLRS